MFYILFIIIYAFDTHRIAQATLASASPSVSCSIISGKNYYKTTPVNPTEDMEMELYLDTRVLIQNHSRFGTEAYVNLNPKVYGKPIEMPPKYSGRESWALEPFQGINGRFSIRDVLRIVGKTAEQMKSERSNENAHSQLTMNIEVQYKGFLHYLIKNPTQHWCFDFKDNLWYNRDYGYYA